MYIMLYVIFVFKLYFELVMSVRVFPSTVDFSVYSQSQSSRVQSIAMTK